MRGKMAKRIRGHKKRHTTPEEDKELKKLITELNDDSDIEVEGAVLRCSRGDQFDRSYIAFESTFTIEDLPRNLASPGTGRGVII